MLVNYVTDEPGKIPAIRAMLEPQFHVVPQVLQSDNAQAGASGMLMVDADLRKQDCVERIKRVLRVKRTNPEKMFVVPAHLQVMIAQAYALGATTVVSRPREIISKLIQFANDEKAEHNNADSASPETQNSATAFASMFSTAQEGNPVNLADAEYATSQIITNIARNGFNRWLDEIRRHHEGTFQHCLLVTGIAVGFALDLGFCEADVKRLGLSATLHDIGKARIPLAVLDKRGELTPAEEEIMRCHPVIGYDLLKDIPRISSEALDGVRHHHEYLDGSGYPDGLAGSDISDLVRLLTISDIFAALIELRPYRPAMSRVDAYKILCGMDGKLEGALVKAFQGVALNGTKPSVRSR
ncbi:HD-GYP domain-containing protein [Nitrobacter sp.]|jgi:putative nucleotidyltransferase with HDIG domain|uniref:HD-GYP domain-containing protein n=1 Tax=Nitrobacter sp. TaxID=29420 RepID=UPI003F653A81